MSVDAPPKAENYRPILTYIDYELGLFFTWTGIPPEPIEVRLQIGDEQPKDIIPTDDFNSGSRNTLPFWMGWFHGICENWTKQTFGKVSDVAANLIDQERDGDELEE